MASRGASPSRALRRAADQAADEARQAVLSGHGVPDLESATQRTKTPKHSARSAASSGTSSTPSADLAKAMSMLASPGSGSVADPDTALSQFRDLGAAL